MTSSDVKFFKKNELSDKLSLEVQEIWEESFGGEIEMGLLDETIIGILFVKEEIVSILFLLNPSKELLDSDNKYYTNIKLQGVTEKDFYLYNLCVTKKQRKKGYGKLLLQNSHKYVKSLNINKILLFVDNGNVPAISMYNKFGYSVQRAMPNGFIMEKNL